MQYGRFGKELQILLKHPQHRINISNRIVDVKGDAKTVVSAGAYDIVFGQLFDEGRSLGTVQNNQGPHTVVRRFGTKSQLCSTIQKCARKLRDVRCDVVESYLLQKADASHCGINVGDRRRAGLETTRRGRQF